MLSETIISLYQGYLQLQIKFQLRRYIGQMLNVGVGVADGRTPEDLIRRILPTLNMRYPSAILDIIVEEEFVGCINIWLAPDQLPSALRIHEEWDVDLEEALSIRQEVETEFLNSFFAQELPSGAPRELSRAARELLVERFGTVGQISASNTEAAMDRYEMGNLQHHPCRRAQTGAAEEAQPTGTTGELSSVNLATTLQILLDIEIGELHDDETIAETASSRSFDAEGENDEKPSQDQNLMNLLYRIAEDQAKKEGFVHRGVTCNSCNVLPIRGIRYRCTNCHDYDLCEQCEALQVHDKTHLFYKIRVPAPFLGNPRQPTPVWYPGKPGKANRNLTTELRMTFSTTTGIQDRQVDAYWEQFQCLAASRYLNDPHGFNVAIDRESFDQCFVPNVTPRPPPPNLVYDRMFSFYDTNDDGLIGFEEFLSGIACIANNGKELRTRIFRAYDVDSDGFVDRKDFLRMFRANYALTKELTRQVVSGMDDEFFDEEDARELVAGGQPISSIFSGAIPRGEATYPGEGKSGNRYGDLVIYDGQGIFQEGGDQVYGIPQAGDNVIVDNAEFAHFGTRDYSWRSDWSRSTLETSDDKWPQSWVTSRDVEEALGRVAAPDTIEDRVERSLVLCAAQERAQQDWWIREAFRRRTTTSRWQARQFYLDGESMTEPPWATAEVETTEDGDTYPENDLCSLRIKALDRIEQSQFIEGFREGIKREIRKKWPDYPDLAQVPARFGTWIRKRYKWHNLAEALAPTRSDIPEATTVIWSLFHNFFGLRRFVTPGRSSDVQGSPPFSPTSSILRCNTEDALEGKADGSNDGQSRSTSPRRALDSTELPQVLGNVESEWSPEAAASGEPDHDGDDEARSAASISSKSLGVLVGERYEENETPAPDADIGHEVIYQVTQESMNELLDPIFKLREDLAVQVMKTRWEREMRKDEIGECMRDDFAAKLMALFQDYQKRWYQSPREECDTLSSSQSIKFVEFILKCFQKPELPDFRNSNGHMDKAKHIGSANLLEATDAIIQLDQSVAKEVHGESLLSMSEQRQGTAKDAPGEASETPVSGYSAVAADLHEGVTAFDDAVLTVEESTKIKPLELLLADAGYGIITPPVQDFERSETSLVSSPESTTVESAEQDEPDLTLPHNRPNNLAEWETRYGPSQASVDTENTPQSLSIRSTSEVPKPESLPPLSKERLLILAIWNVIEEDDRSRGGPGRLNLHDYELIMEGDKGQALGFVGSWVETAAF
ncbi:MAG: hypothetical protein Q9225_003147 [Loekoesia sp. 1 TL-2023]